MFCPRWPDLPWSFHHLSGSCRAGRSCLRTGLHRSEQEHHSWRQEPWLNQKHPGLSCAIVAQQCCFFFIWNGLDKGGDNDDSLMLWLFHVMFLVIPLSSSSSQQQRKETVNMWFCLHPWNPWAFDNISTHPGLLLLLCSWKMMEHGLCFTWDHPRQITWQNQIA